MINTIKRTIFITAWLALAVIFVIIELIATLVAGKSVEQSVDVKLGKALDDFSRWMVKFLRIER